MLCCWRSFIDSLVADVLSNSNPSPNAGSQLFPILTLFAASWITTAIIFVSLLVFQNTIDLNVNTYIRLVSYDHNDNPSFKFDPRVGLEFLDFLPVLSLHYPVCIQASFNDLLLVCTQVPTASFYEYYICNPFTKHWLKLPPIPIDETRTRVMIGFLCDSYICDSDSDSDRERILCPKENTTQIQTQLQVQIFCSETNEWCNLVVSSPRMLNFNPFMPISCHAGLIACNGMLHWVCVKDKEIKGFVVFNPFNDSKQCHYIHPPIDLSLRHFVSLGVFRWRLRIFQLISFYPHNFYAGSFSLWELEDYSHAGTWCMKREVYFGNMVFGDFLESAKNINGLDYVDERAKMMLYRDMTFLAFHPNDGDSVFLDCGNSVQLCNLRTGVMKRVYYRSPVRSQFQLVQPSWPTPFPPLPLNAPPYQTQNSKWDFLASRDLF